MSTSISSTGPIGVSGGVHTDADGHVRQSPRLTQFSTVRVPYQERLPLWEEYNERSLVSLHCRTLADAGLVAAIQNLQLPRMRFTEIRGNDHLVERSAGNIRSTPSDTILLCLLLKGTGVYYYSGGSLALAAGDAILYDPDEQPFIYGFPTAMHQVILEVPRVVYTERSSDDGPIRPRILGHTMDRALPEHIQTAIRTIRNAIKAPPADLDLLEEAALDLFGLITGTSDSSRGHLFSAKEYIRVHLHEPDLSSARIARSTGISERHLGRLFAAEGNTVAKSIMEMRLSRAQEQLKDPTRQGLSIGGIAMSLGFVSAAHFSRTFKQAYGHTPSDLRSKP